MLEFDIYIGKKMFIGQDDKIIAIVVPKFDIPTSQYSLIGEVIDKNKNQHFISLNDLCIYFCEWIELAGNKMQIKVTVYLNILSLRKSLIGYEIIELIKKLENMKNYNVVRNFKEII